MKIDIEKFRGEVLFVLTNERFDWDFVNKAKALAGMHPHGKGFYKEQNNAWKIKSRGWEDLLKTFPAPEAYTNQAREEITRLRDAQATVQHEKNHIRERLLKVTPDYLMADFGGDKLKSYQIQAVMGLVNGDPNLNVMPGSGFLFDSIGVGKSHEGMALARLFQDAFGTKTVIIAKRILFEQWRKLAEKFEVPAGLYSLHHSQIPAPEDIGQEYFLIVDEAHLCRGLKSKIGEAYVSLAQAAKGFVALTGSPCPTGKCRELWNHLVAIRHPLSHNKRHFDMHFCEAHFDSYGWSLEGGRNQKARLQELKAHIEPFTFARTLEQIAEIPPETYVPIWAEETKKTQRELSDILQQFVADTESENLRWIIEHNFLSAEQIDGWIRQATSLVKLPATIELAEVLRDAGHNILIGFEFVEPAKRFADQFKCPLLIGETPEKDRLRIVENFQKHGGAIAMTAPTGGVGLNLQKASVIIRNSRSWVYENNRQFVGRAVRTGQDKKIVVYDILYGQHERRMTEVLKLSESGISEVVPIRQVMKDAVLELAELI